MDSEARGYLLLYITSYLIAMVEVLSLFKIHEGGKPSPIHPITHPFSIIGSGLPCISGGAMKAMGVLPSFKTVITFCTELYCLWGGGTLS